MSDRSFYTEVFKANLGTEVEVKNVTAVAGGCINQTNKVVTNKGTFFIKVNSINQEDLFIKEQLGLTLLQEKSQLGVPGIICGGISGNNSYLILEWIEKGVPNEHFWRNFGQKLARQHRESAAQFGLDHNNHIGRLSQSNSKHADWYLFFIEERLKPQLNLAERSGLIGNIILSQFEVIFSKLSQLIPSEPPSLLHGDLWSGNFLCGQESTPYIFDPAVYYGHRETELSFTTMFGGFDQVFYSAYAEEFDLEAGFDDRIEIHNLYPLLVHVNLFGSSYLSGIRQTLNRFA